MTKASRPQVGDTRYFAEYLDYAAGKKHMIDGGGDPDYDTMWDYCQQEDITVRKPFPSKEAAVAWAQKNRELDVFNTPRVQEDTFVEIPGDELHLSVSRWEQTGYWEVDGDEVLEIEADLSL